MPAPKGTRPKTVFLEPRWIERMRIEAARRGWSQTRLLNAILRRHFRRTLRTSKAPQS